VINRTELKCAELLARFRKLVLIARTAGADAALLDQTSQMLVAALIELTEYRAGSRDPRRRASLELGLRIARARANGVSMEALTERFGLKRSRIYDLLALVREQERTNPLLTADDPIEKEPR
jgi:hypothetical protein